MPDDVVPYWSKARGWGPGDAGRHTVFVMNGRRKRDGGASKKRIPESRIINIMKIIVSWKGVKRDLSRVRYLCLSIWYLKNLPIINRPNMGWQAVHQLLIVQCRPHVGQPCLFGFHPLDPLQRKVNVGMR